MKKKQPSFIKKREGKTLHGGQNLKIPKGRIFTERKEKMEQIPFNHNNKLPREEACSNPEKVVYITRS